MLNSFQISNFRLFEKLEVKKLGRVNLIVGKNNSGKSTFLEAIQIYANNATYEILLDLIYARQETWSNDVNKSHLPATRYAQNLFLQQVPNFRKNSVRHLFFGHQIPEINEQGLSLGEVPPSIPLNLYVAIYKNQQNDELGLRKVRIYPSQLPELNEDLDDVEIYLVAEEGERLTRLFRLEMDLTSPRHQTLSGIYERQENLPKYVYQTVSTDNMSSKRLAYLWNLTSLTDLKSDVISALKLIDQRVVAVVFVDGEIDERIPMVQMQGIDEPLPLKSMGDGIMRIFHITVALVNAKNGILLIDEFENGLHWTVQPKVWDIIFQLAERLNVQIFATTYSRDCVQAFEKIWNKYPESGAFFRLDEKNGKIKATEYTLETLADSLEMDVEVR